MKFVTKRILSLAGAIAIVASGVVSVPANASTAVVLPAGANGTNGNPDLMAYACPAGLYFFAPAPVNQNPYSSWDPIQPGNFKWTLTSDHISSPTELYEGSGLAAVPAGYVDYTSIKTAGTVLQFTLTGSIDGGSFATYTDSSFNFSVTVVDPSFAQGTGSFDDPFLIESVADLNKMRCYDNKHFRLTQNLTLSGRWLPIGFDSRQFRGALDGNGFKISGLNAGHPTMSAAVGLFGNVRHFNVYNLTLENPSATGRNRVGTLIGDGNYGTVVQNVKVQNAQASGASRVGLLGGDVDYGALFSENDVNGTISAVNPIYRQVNGNQVRIMAEGSYDIGGMLGHEDGDGTNHIRNKVDVQITVKPASNFIARALADNLTVSNDMFVRSVSGYVGEADDHTTFTYIDVKSNINIEAFGQVRLIGGFTGESKTPIRNSKIETDINIVYLGPGDGDRVERVGGAVGYANEQTAMFTDITSKINIEAGSAANNTFGIVAAQPITEVREIGGAFGEIDDRSGDLYTRTKTEISISGATDVSRVAGYAGEFDDDESIGHLDNVVSGSINVTAAGQASAIGGFTNLTSSSSLVSGVRNVAAVAISVTAPTTASVNPFAGQVVNVNIQRARNSYWDSSVTNLPNSNNYPVLGLQTSQLQSRSFLTEIGFDFNNVWQLDGGYPELRPGVYTFGFTGGAAAASSGSSSPAQSRPYEGPTILSVSRVVEGGFDATVTGLRLNTIARVFVAGESVPFKLNSNGTLSFTTPKLKAGVYTVVFDVPTAQTTLTASLELRGIGSAAPTPSPMGTVNVGSFNGKLVVYASGLNGARISWKVGGVWGVGTATSNYSIFNRPTPRAGVTVSVDVYVNGVKTLTKSVVTR